MESCVKNCDILSKIYVELQTLTEDLKYYESIMMISTSELQKVLNVPSILKLAMEMFPKSAEIFNSGIYFSV